MSLGNIGESRDVPKNAIIEEDGGRIHLLKSEHIECGGNDDLHNP